MHIHLLHGRGRPRCVYGGELHRRDREVRRWFLSHPDRFLLVDKAEDIARAKQAGKLGVCLNFQGSLQYQRNLHLVEVYKRLGVHHALLTYNNKNLVGDGCHERTDAGLSSFGLALIAEMNRVGVLVDVTHAGHATALEAIEASSAPVIMSHSLLHHLDHERNVPDDQMIAAAKKGGVIGMNGLGIFMSADGMDISAERLFAFLDYSVQLVGARHVGFGLDYIMYPAHAQKGVVATTGTSYKKDAGYHNAVHLFAAPSIIAELVEMMLRHQSPRPTFARFWATTGYAYFARCAGESEPFCMTTAASEVLILSGRDVRSALSIEDCIEIIDRTMRSVSSGGAQLPLRTVMKLPGSGNLFAAMPGFIEGPSGALGAKLVAVYPENPRQGRSSHLGVIVLFDPQTGAPAALVDATEVTAIRTAAASAVATRALANPGAGAARHPRNRRAGPRALARWPPYADYDA